MKRYGVRVCEAGVQRNLYDIGIRLARGGCRCGTDRRADRKTVNLGQRAGLYGMSYPVPQMSVVCPLEAASVQDPGPSSPASGPRATTQSRSLH